MEKLREKSEKRPNEAQKKCICDTKYGKYLVIAGPGTGKTYTVTNKIKYMIEEDGVEPEKILCLTFSSTAAREMKNKIGDEYNVDVYTYHEFCLDIIKNFEDEFDIETPNVASDTMKRNIIVRCISELFDKNKLKAYNNEKNNPYKFVREITLGIEEIKKNRITKEQFEYNLKNNPMWQPRLNSLPQLIADKKAEIETFADEKALINNQRDSRSIELTTLIGFAKKELEDFEKEQEKLEAKITKMKELWDLCELYNDKLHNEYGYIDFYDMIDMVLKKFEDKNSKLLEEIAYKYEYILVDEYQDTNKCQNDIVFALSDICTNIFVVGDDDQIIYTFQGADLNTLENYMQKFNALPIILTENHRSTQTILNVSGKMADIQNKYIDYKYLNLTRTIDKLENQSDRKNSDEIKLNLYRNKLRDNIAKEQENPLKLRLCSKADFKKKLPEKYRENAKQLICPEVSDMYGVNNPVEYYSFEKEEDERNFIVNKIIKLKKEFDEFNKTEKEEAQKGNREPKLKKLSDIAILTKSNDDLNDYEKYLKVNGVRVEITSGKNIFDISSVDVLLTYMQFLLNPAKYSDNILAYMALDVFDIDKNDYKILYEHKPRRNKNLIDNINDILKKGYSEKELKEELNKILNRNADERTLKDEIEELIKSKSIKLTKEASLQKFVTDFDDLKNYIKQEKDLTKVIIEIGKRTGIFRHYIQDEMNAVENIKGIKKIISEAENFKAQSIDEIVFPQFVEYLANSKDNDIKIKTEQEEKPLNAVQLSTYHSSKGREFGYVFMPKLTDAKFESNTSTKKEHLVPLDFPKDATYEQLKDNLEQERFLDFAKLFYVAMTRAKHTLILSSIDLHKYNSTKTWFIQNLINCGAIEEKEPDEEISDIDEPMIYSDYFPEEDEDYKEFLRNRIYEPFSPSALNSYRKCPKRYLYEYIYKLRFNKENDNDDNLIFGNAVHEAFEFAINYQRENKKYPSCQDAYAKFEECINKSSHTDPNSAKKSAKEHIFGENNFYQKYFINLTDGEYEIIDTLAESEVKYISESGNSFIGKIDRIDKIKDANGKESYIIYDYKTGINTDGFTPSGAHSDYLHQIAFYKFLFEKYNKGANVSKACFLFPLLKEPLVIPPSLTGNKLQKSTDDVTATLLRCAEGIKNLQFDKTDKCNDNFCPFKDICFMKIYQKREKYE